MIDTDTALAAFEARDRSRDGSFVVAVRTTGIYCKPSCPARRPRRENIAFYADGPAAVAAGYRPCRRCRPDEAARDSDAVREAIRLIEASDERLVLDDIARAVRYAPHHFHRLFKRDTGLTPAAYARGLRADRLSRRLDEAAGSVTEAIYEAGYEASSRAYADAKSRFGMTPSTRQAGGAGETIRHAVVPTSLGPLLIAATDKGLCRIAFDEDQADLAARFPNAEIIGEDAGFCALVQAVVAAVDDPMAARADLPLDIRGTAFQQAVWQALRTIPVGETRSYAQLATMAGRPGAVRAVGTACGGNALAVVIPCHRIVRSDGGIGGYAYGAERKTALLEREKPRS
ncbi:MAG: bifunctional DNA-binding transcriptional regulator/O6-methylguanine-DNA methyltransferase Ada [Sphingobium sp.]